MSNISFSQSVPVSKVFIEKYMPTADELYLKVYLYGLYLYTSGKKKLNNKYIANKLSITESDVIKSWKYWQSEGIIGFNIEDNGDFSLEYKDINNNVQNLNKTAINLDTRPSYNTSEISKSLKEDSSLSYLYKYYEKLSGKALSSSDITILFSLYDWLKLPIEVIIMLLEYCYSINKINMRYIEKVAIDWTDKGLNSIEKVEEYLKNLENWKSKIAKLKKSIGISNRDLSPTEKQYISKWLNEYNLSNDLITYGYDITIINTGGLSFPYLNSILTSWYKKGITSVSEAEKEVFNYTKKKKPSNSKKKKRQTKDFSSINKREYNFIEIEKAARKRIFNEE